jgi:hypothetical protein
MSNELAVRLEAAWEEAGDRLGIDVETSYVLDSSTGSTVFSVYLPDFGGRDGIVLNAAGHGEGDLPRQIARDAGLRYAEQHSTFGKYDREEFVAALNEWGWYGPTDDAPDWYVG